MKKTIVAIFDDISVARQVVEELVDAEFARGSISLITNDTHHQYSHYLDKDYTPKDDAVTATQDADLGAAVGAFTGILAGLAALMIPGIGLTVVAGPIVADLTATVAGTLPGGVIGALVKSDVPEDEAPYYAEGIRRGGTLISIHTSDTLRAQDIMNRHGAINIHERINIWLESGWKGFETDAFENEGKAASFPEMLTSGKVRSISTALAGEEPPIDDEDTTQSIAVMDSYPTLHSTVPVTPSPDGMTAAPVH